MFSKFWVTFETILQNWAAPIWVKQYSAFSHWSALLLYWWAPLSLGMILDEAVVFESSFTVSMTRSERGLCWKAIFLPFSHTTFPCHPTPPHPIPTLTQCEGSCGRVVRQVIELVQMKFFFKLLLCARQVTEHFTDASAGFSSHQTAPSENRPGAVPQWAQDHAFPSKCQLLLEVPETSQESLLLFSSYNFLPQMMNESVRSPSLAIPCQVFFPMVLCTCHRVFSSMVHSSCSR